MLLTKEEYYNKRGIDLAKELGQIDNSNYVNIFLQEQEDWLRNYHELEIDDINQSTNIKTKKLIKKHNFPVIFLSLIISDCSNLTSSNKS